MRTYVSRSHTFILCPYLAQEAKYVLHALSPEFGEQNLAFFPTHCATKGQPDWAHYVQHKGVTGQVHIIGGSCLPQSGALFKDPRVHVHKLPHCFSWLITPELIASQLQQGAYVVFPGWAAQWRTHLRVLGFDPPSQATDFFQDSLTKIVLLDTGMHQHSRDHVQALASAVGLSWEVLPAGVQYLQLQLTQILLRAHTEQSRSSSEHRDRQQGRTRHRADYATALDLLGTLNQAETEQQTIASILDIFAMLFAPRKLSYLRFWEGSPQQVYFGPESQGEDDPSQIAKRLAAYRQPYAWTESGQGFVLTLTYQDKTLGVVEADELTFPEYREYYLNLALNIVNICGLALENVQKLEKIKEYTARIEELAFVDVLTGAWNRRYFLEALEKEIQRSHRYERNLSLAFMDIDFFKTINDTYGHAGGDQVLQVLTAMIQENIRSVDILGRIGGEEFAIILPETDLHSAQQGAERIRREVEKRVLNLDGQTLHFTISIGLADLHTADTVDSLLQRADQAMYRAKGQGKNQVQCA